MDMGSKNCRRLKMIKPSLFCAVFLVALAMAAGAARADDDAVSAARAAGLAWLAIADRGQAAAAWEAAAPLFQAAVSVEDWERSLRAARGPLGALESREEISAEYSKTLPGAPDGDYVVFKFSTRLAHKAEAVETLILTKTGDGDWRVSGYFIR